MAYTAYEITAGSSALNGVAALCQHLTAAGSFSTTTQPTLAQVEGWLTEGYGLINTRLMHQGYKQDQTDTDLLRALQPYNIWYAAAMAEYSQASAGFSEGSGGRGDMFMAMFWGSSSRDGKLYLGLDALIQSKAFALLGAGIHTDPTDYLSVGGISRDEKRTAEQDADLVPFMFTRDKFSAPGTRVSTQYSGDGRADL